MAENENENESESESEHEVVIHVSGASLPRLEHVGGQHNQLTNEVRNGNENVSVIIREGEAEANESASVDDRLRTLWKAENNGHGYEHLLAHANESGCGRLA